MKSSAMTVSRFRVATKSLARAQHLERIFRARARNRWRLGMDPVHEALKDLLERTLSQLAEELAEAGNLKVMMDGREASPRSRICHGELEVVPPYVHANSDHHLAYRHTYVKFGDGPKLYIKAIQSFTAEEIHPAETHAIGPETVLADAM